MKVRSGKVKVLLPSKLETAANLKWRNEYGPKSVDLGPILGLGAEG